MLPESQAIIEEKDPLWDNPPTVAELAEAQAQDAFFQHMNQSVGLPGSYYHTD